MKSLRRRFEAIARRDKELGSYICFVRAIRGRGFSGKTVRYWFRKLVSAEDYDVRDTRKLLRHVYQVTSTPEEGMN